MSKASELDDDVGSTEWWRDIRDMDRDRRERNGARARQAQMPGWKEHTAYHWSRKVAGKLLNYWPTKNKWHYDGREFFGDAKAINAFVEKREHKPTNVAAREGDGT